MRCSLFLSFAFLVFVSAQALPTKDEAALKELKALGENLRRTTLDSELSNRLVVAQLIIDAQVAPPSVIDSMRAFIAEWRPVLTRVTFEDFAKFSVDFPKMLDLKDGNTYKDDNGGLNYYTKGGFSIIKSKIEREDRDRLTSYKDIAMLKMTELTQETKQGNTPLMNAFNNFVNQKKLRVRNFFTFLKELRQY
ncbi:uncharacterized protein LOC132798448 [Drosophila nasuta]|uniref:uncharacterized protein LOC132798448 n=1 Tax=Drosophila nasuta TaxID=42062 RepID=UPI00295F0E8D|nr:uncharacterized protein LOC132798448 [Drosophila nasuta]